MDLVLCYVALIKNRAMCRNFELQFAFITKLSLRRLVQCHCSVEAFAIGRAESSGVRTR